MCLKASSTVNLFLDGNDHPVLEIKENYFASQTYLRLDMANTKENCASVEDDHCLMEELSLSDLINTKCV